MNTFPAYGYPLAALARVAVMSAMPFTASAELSEPYRWPSMGRIFGYGAEIAREGCNTVSYGSAPGLDITVGRIYNNDKLDGTCPPESTMSLTAVRMDWKN